jgi:hypothetical protein
MEMPATGNELFTPQRAPASAHAQDLTGLIDYKFSPTKFATARTHRLGHGSPKFLSYPSRNFVPTDFTKAFAYEIVRVFIIKNSRL